MNKKKILLVGPYFSKGCGISRYEEGLISEFKKENRVFHVKVNFLRNKNIFEILKVIKGARRIKPDLIQIQYTPTLCGPLFLYVLKKLHDRYKIIINSHEKISVYYKYLGRFYKLLCYYEREVIKNCDYYFVHNNDHKESLTRIGILGRKIKITKFPVYFFEGGEKKPNEVFEKYKLPINKKLNVAFFGQIREKKGISTLINTIRKLDQNLVNKFNMLILGGYSKKDRKYFRNIKKKTLGLNFYFSGFIEHEDISALFKKVDLLVLPYKNCTESGVLFHIAIPFKIPVLASYAGGLKNISKIRIGKNFKDNYELKIKLEEFLSGKWDLESFEYDKIINSNKLNKVCKRYINLIK